MLNRLLRSAIVFAAIFAAYEAYVLLAVPWMEPPLALLQERGASDEDPYPGQDSLTKYQLLLSHYFPNGHWTQQHPPKVFASSNGQAMLVLDAYKRLAVTPGDSDAAPNAAVSPAVQIKIDRFAMLVFPTPPLEGVTPPRDAIILESPQGATLEFDEFRPEHGRIGQIRRGEFPGRISIRSDMDEPGPQDDLLIETADLQMNTRLLYTASPVRFRMGPNIGGGRELEIRFLPDEHLQPQRRGFRFAGVGSLEIRRDVRMRLQFEMESFLPGTEQPGDNATGSRALRGNEVEVVRNEGVVQRPPVELMCSGPFHFDFLTYVASVDGDVLLRQINPNGQSDQLTCNQLDLQFAPKALNSGQPAAVIVDPGRRQRRDLGRLEPAALVAIGHPVVVSSPARGAEARGDRLQIDLRDRRLMISGGQSVYLVYGPNVLRAPAIEYQHPAPESQLTLGRFAAAGPGSLHYVPDPSKPDEAMQATWQRTVELGRDRGQPALAMEGRPKLEFAGSGAIMADGIMLYLREIEAATETVGLSLSTQEHNGKQAQIVPDRLAAKGRVEIQSPRLNGRTHELHASFRRQASDDSTIAATPTSTTSPNTPPPNGGFAGAFGSQLNPAEAGQPYHIDADRIEVSVQLLRNSVSPSSIVCDGNVIVREIPEQGATEQPFTISGERLTVDQLDRGAAHITLSGSGGRDAPRIKHAVLSGRGVTVTADAIELDQRDNRLWSEGPGNATLLVTRDFEGRPAATPIPIEVSWKGGLEFDGRTVVLRRGVVAAGAEGALHCDQMSARLTAAVQMGEQVDRQAIDLAGAECRGNVVIDHKTRDATGLLSHERVQLARLSIDQRTGTIAGDGPGVVRSTRFGGGLGALALPKTLSTRADNASANVASGSKLHYLAVFFQRGISGNLYNRELTFHERVRTVYGPVDSWEQELDADRPETLPPDSVRLLCDELRINEDPIAARTMLGSNVAAGIGSAQSRPLGPVQLQARTNVRIDGQSAERGPFIAQADRASYEQSKDVFLLEGNPRTPATISYAGQTGPPPAFQRLSFVRSTGEIKGKLLYLEVSPGDVESARRANSIRQ